MSNQYEKEISNLQTLRRMLLKEADVWSEMESPKTSASVKLHARWVNDAIEALKRAK